MYIPKRYGQSKIDNCPFCGKTAVTVNSQKVPVCTSHKDSELSGLKCVCGSTLDILHGKFGVFFNCMNCGNMNLRKVLEINDVDSKQNTAVKTNVNSLLKKTANINNTNTGTISGEAESSGEKKESNSENNSINNTIKETNTSTKYIPEKKKSPREITIRSDDPNYF